MNIKQAIYMSCAIIFTGFQAMPTNAYAQQGSVCVICNEPAKIYQCNYQNHADPAVIAAASVKGLQFSCIQEIAEYGNHGQCAATRRSIANCRGEIYTLKRVPPTETKVKLQNKETVDPVIEVRPPEEIEPPSLVETTAKTYEKTASSLKKGYKKTTSTVKDGYKKTTSTVTKTVKSIGGTIGDAASQTYDCVVSWFSKCGK